MPPKASGALADPSTGTLLRLHTRSSRGIQGPSQFRQLLPCVESQVSQATDIKEHVLASAYSTKEHMLANAAPGDKARTIHVETSFGKAPRCSAVPTLSLGSSNINGKHFA